MDRRKGISPEEVATNDALTDYAKSLAEAVAAIQLEQIFTLGSFHADLPGNMLILEDGRVGAHQGRFQG